MRAIIIDDKDCQALVDKLSLTKYEATYYGPTMAEAFKLVQKYNFNPEEAKFLFDITHRKFHYDVVTWLQKHGWKPYP